MLALLAPIKARLQPLPALTGWALHTVAEEVDRRVVPRAAIGFGGARVAGARTTAAHVEPSMAVTLVVRRGATAAASLDAAMAAVIAELHNWLPGERGGRRWEPLRLVQITEPDFETEEGLVGLTLVLNTQALYHGQP